MLEEFRAAGELGVYKRDLAHPAWKGYAAFYALLFTNEGMRLSHAGNRADDSYWI
jgi:hypothetical protein